MNGNMFDELREILKGSGELSQDAVNRLTLGALAEINQQFIGHVQVEEKRNEGVLTLKDSVDDLAKAVEELTRTVSKLSTELYNLQDDVKNLKSNPFVSLGKYIKEKPKQAIAWGVGIFVGAYFLIGFRFISLIVVLVGSLVGVKQETLEWMLKWMSQ